MGVVDPPYALYLERTLTMELKLEVLASTAIKRKKPWPKFTWLAEVSSTYNVP